MFSRRSVVAAALALPVAGIIGPARAAQSVQLTVGYIPVLGSASVFVIDEAGWDKEAGLSLKFVRFDSGPAMIQALASGQLDVYVGGVGPLIVARQQGINVKVVAASAVEEMGVLARGKLAEAASHGGTLPEIIARFTAKEGRKPKFSTQPPGSVPDTVLRHWLAEMNKVDLAAVEIVGMGIDATQQSLLAGAVDGANLREPAITILRDRAKDAVILATGGQMFPNQPGGVVGALQGRGAEKSAAVERLVALHVRATKLLTEKPAEAAPLVHKGIGGGLVPLDVIARALTSPFSKFVADPRRILEATDRMQAYQHRLGVLKGTVPVEELFDAGPYLKAGA